jgi:hypothetical protein
MIAPIVATTMLRMNEPSRCTPNRWKMNPPTSDESEHDVAAEALAALVDDLTGEEPGDQADDQPDDQPHQQAAVVAGVDCGVVLREEGGEVEHGAFQQGTGVGARDEHPRGAFQGRQNRRSPRRRARGKSR